MNRRKFLAASAALPLAAHSAILHPEPAGSNEPTTHARGDTASGRPNFDRYHLTLNRVLQRPQPAYSQPFLLEDLRGEPGRRFTNFSGDLSGRWIGALAASSTSFGDDFPVLDEFVKKALPLQHPEGYFGKSFNAEHPGDDDLALLWGNGRLLVGLMEYHALRHDPAALVAARRLGDFLVAIGPQIQFATDGRRLRRRRTSPPLTSAGPSRPRASPLSTPRRKKRSIATSARISRRAWSAVPATMCTATCAACAERSLSTRRPRIKHPRSRSRGLERHQCLRRHSHHRRRSRSLVAEEEAHRRLRRVRLAAPQSRALSRHRRREVSRRGRVRSSSTNSP